MPSCSKRVKLSVVIPTLNSASTLGRSIESLLSQSFTDWELLVMDGGSTDDTVVVANGYHDDRIKVHSSPDKGIYDAMNKGIGKSVGEWLYFLGSDDYLYDSSSLERILSDTEGCDMVYGDVEASQLPDEFHGAWRYDHLEYNRCHQCIFYRRSVFDRIGSYPLKYRICADYYMNLRVFLDKRMHLKYCPVTVAHYTQGGASETTNDMPFYVDRDRLIVRYGLRTLPRSVLAKHCRLALNNHCTHMQRILLNLLLLLVER